MVMVGYGHQGEEAVIYVAYFKIICAMGVERRDKGSALFHITKNSQLTSSCAQKDYCTIIVEIGSILVSCKAPVV